MAGEKRITPRNVQEAGRGLHSLAQHMGLLKRGERWAIIPGNSTTGDLWHVEASAGKSEVWVPGWLSRTQGVIGRTSTEAHETLLTVRDTLAWLQHTHHCWGGTDEEGHEQGD